MASKRKGISWLRLALWGLLGALLLPIIQTGCVRYVDPPITTLMLLREAESRWASTPHKSLAYQWVDLDRIDRDFLHLVLVAEDQRFFQHNGFDWKEIETARNRAAKTNEPVRGASTISMQCSRSLFLWPGRSWVRKGAEAYYTFWLELFVPKRRILELYANVAELGPHIYGIGAAAERYYRTEAHKLTRAQAAMIASLLPAPTAWDPHAPSPRLRKRYARLLRTPESLPIPGWNEAKRKGR
jgi:monofunctional biosynthetic peptidoglycan transglycosylase